MKMDNTKNQFVMTFDNDVANKLKLDGYTLLSEDHDKYVFINNGTLKFSDDEDMSKVYDKMHYTNVLCMA